MEGRYSIFVNIRSLVFIFIIFLKVSTKICSKFPNIFELVLFFIIFIKRRNNLSINKFR